MPSQSARPWKHVAAALAAALAVTALAGCASPDAPAPGPPEVPAVQVFAHPDPLAPGPFTVTELTYDLGSVEVGGADAQHSDYEYDHRLEGVLYVPDGAGPFPLAVFLHGQHSTCAFMGGEALLNVDDCSDDAGLNTPYPNHLGYAYLGHHLASHGVVVASILGHEVNRFNGNPDIGMWARGELVLATIDALVAAAANGTGDGAIPELAGRIDAARIGIMGHSRGGEGVVTAVHVNQARPPSERWPIAAVVALAPTDFNARAVVDSALLSLVPYCDGDVYSPHGLRTYDHSVAARHNVSLPLVQVLAMGANHNFYNTMWGARLAGPVSDGNDAFPGSHLYPECDLSHEAGGGRLTPEDTLAEATLHIGGFLRWRLLGDATLGPYFSGAAATPAGACPAAAASCAGATHASLQMAGQSLWAASEGEPDFSGFSGLRSCQGTRCHPNMYSSAHAVAAEWTADSELLFTGLAGALPETATSLALRLAVPPAPADALADLPHLSVELRGNGTSTVIDLAGDPAVFFPPDTPGVALLGLGSGAKLSLNAVRISLQGAAVAPAQVDTVIVRFDGATPGTMYVADLVALDEQAALTS